VEPIHHGEVRPYLAVPLDTPKSRRASGTFSSSGPGRFASISSGRSCCPQTSNLFAWTRSERGRSVGRSTV
jgi:hypothetical protein